MAVAQRIFVFPSPPAVITLGPICLDNEGRKSEVGNIFGRDLPLPKLSILKSFAGY